ncbi:hypothetical protein JW960_23155 [candidate division KSB1 bacterium]|nr:hypothetical protein [candidate division KSB1 bacterium]
MPQIDKQFLLGFTTALALTAFVTGIVRLIRFIRLRRQLRHEIENSQLLSTPTLTIGSSQIEPGAKAILLRHRRTLTHTRHPDPEWVKPLVDASVAMVREISRYYYPASSDPLLEPKLTHITAALILICTDINKFVSQNRMLKVLDIRARNVKDVTNFMNRPIVKRFNKVYNVFKWITRVLRYKNPILTGSMLIGKNLTVRYVHFQLITFVGLRAIMLYRGSRHMSELPKQRRTTR